jgi:hypothetical protein
MTIRNNWGCSKSSAKPRRSVTLPADLEAALDELREAAPPPPTDEPIYDYLTSVYRLRCKVASSAELQSALKAYHKANSPRTLQQYAGVIIQTTAGDHVTSKMKYKYVIALDYAFANNVKAKGLKAFIKQQGGFNKCVALWKKWKKKHSGKPRQKPRKKQP